MTGPDTRGVCVSGKPANVGERYLPTPIEPRASPTVRPVLIVLFLLMFSFFIDLSSAARFVRYRTNYRRIDAQSRFTGQKGSFCAMFSGG
jgi:hypothetical protein